MTQIKQKQNIIEGIIGENDANILDKVEVSNQIADYFQNQWGMEEREEMERTTENSTQEILFTSEDIDVAISTTNFSRAIGTDGFDGSLLKRDNEVQKGIASWIKTCLNNGTIPKYLTEGCLVALSKT
jgi:hypothetical protein